MSEPTKAAMRAATTIGRQQMFLSRDLPAIIDRETGLPELVAALREVAHIAWNCDLKDIEAIASEALRKAGEL